MRRILFCSAFALSLIATVGLAQERVEAPVFRDGDFWQYRIVERGEYMKTERELNGVYELVDSTGRKSEVIEIKKTQVLLHQKSL